MTDILVRFVHPEAGSVEASVGDRPLVVGREGSDVVLGDGRVSRKHGRLWREGDSVFYEDTGSSNGSWLEGRRLSAPVRVESARPIVVGETALTLAGSDSQNLPLGMSLQMRLRAGGSVSEVLSFGQPARYATALYDFVQALLASSTQELLERAVSTIQETVPAAQRVAVKAWPTLHSLLPTESPVSLSMARLAVHNREALLLSEEAMDEPEVVASAIRHGIRSAIYVPLLTADSDAVGVLCVDTPRPGIPFSEDDFQFVRALGALLATALVAGRVREVQTRRDAMATFLKIASHDLRNPVGVALVAAKTIMTYDDPKIARELLPCIVEASERAMDLIRTYLEMAGLDAGQTVKLERSWLDARELVQGELEFNRVALPAKRKLELVSRVDCDRVHGDPQRLRQILGNLLSNAVKYSPDGGQITLEVEEGALFRVRDQGKGIAPEDQERLFRQFERLGDTQAQGIGLGLWLTAALVNAHGGRIWVESTPGEGATFAFTIPP